MAPRHPRPSRSSIAPRTSGACPLRIIPATVSRTSPPIDGSDDVSTASIGPSPWMFVPWTNESAFVCSRPDDPPHQPPPQEPRPLPVGRKAVERKRGVSKASLGPGALNSGSSSCLLNGHPPVDNEFPVLVAMPRPDEVVWRPCRSRVDHGTLLSTENRHP
jgi:hypothetical protein